MKFEIKGMTGVWSKKGRMSNLAKKNRMTIYVKKEGPKKMKNN